MASILPVVVDSAIRGGSGLCPAIVTDLLRSGLHHSPPATFCDASFSRGARGQWGRAVLAVFAVLSDHLDLQNDGRSA